LLATVLALNTTASSGELRNLQWQDVNWLEGELIIRKAKTPAGERAIPLNPVAYDALLKLRERAKLLFGDPLSPDWYVFHWEPANKEPDASRPSKGWRSSWHSIVQEAGIGKLRFHDLRHQAITELSEGQASDETIMSIAGHVSRRMMSGYSHIRKGARRAAVNALCRDTVQLNSTVHQNGALPDSYVFEKNGGDDETRTRNLCRDRQYFRRRRTQNQEVRRVVVGARWLHWAGLARFCAAICATSSQLAQKLAQFFVRESSLK
jgi:integrase-like protein